MTIVVDGVETQGPLSSCNWRFGSKLHEGGRNSWWRFTYTQGSVYGAPNGPSWDNVLRGAEFEAEMRRADALARERAGLIEAKPAGPAIAGARGNGGGAAGLIGAASSGKTIITSGKAAYNPGPPSPPPWEEEPDYDNDPDYYEEPAGHEDQEMPEDDRNPFEDFGEPSF
jgi:hypothetical protein